MSTDPEPDDARDSGDGEWAEGNDGRRPAVDPDLDASGFAQRLVTGAADAVVSVDDEYTIVFANPAVTGVFGYDPETLIGEPLETLVPDSIGQRLRETVDQYLTVEDAGDWQDIRFPGQHRSGHRIQLSISFFAHGDGEGDVYFTGIFRDVTDRVEREVELEQQNEQLTRLASILSHDLREPLNNARAKLTLAQETGKDGYIEEVKGVHQRMAELIDDVLTLTTKGQPVGETEPIELGTVVEDARSTVQTDEIQLHLEGSSTIRADPERLQTLVENLITNAARHAGPDVKVWIGTLPGERGFFVADDGPGIPEGEREEVFEYGYTNADDGTGLGLSIVWDIANAHGWSAEVTSSRADGARFEFGGVELADQE